MEQKVIEGLQSARIEWESSVDSPYIFIADVQGKHVRLRLNDFPAEPLCTLMIDGEQTDLDELPKLWTLPRHRAGTGA